MTHEFLPWESRGGVGICLSGGGLRAASFSCGAVQALQEDRGLLYGPGCADYVAVVSGGSYLGAALMLNAAHVSAQATSSDIAPPLALGTPEAAHVVSHGNYLKNWGTPARMLAAGAVNILAFVAIFLWAGVMFHAAIAVADWLGVGSPVGDAWQIALAAAFVFGARLALRGLYIDGGFMRIALPLIGAVIVIVTAPATLAAIRQASALSDTTWWTQVWWRIPLAVSVCVVLITVSVGLARFWPRQVVTRLAAWVVARLPAIVGAIAFCLVATAIAPRIERGSAPDATNSEAATAFTILFVALVGAYVMQRLARTSLHGMYRDSLATCFSVRRRNGDVELVAPTAQKLSELTPPASAEEGCFPRLLVCATANVVWDPARPSSRPIFRLPWAHVRRFALFVYSHDRCGMPGVPHASISTTDLEKLTTPAGIRNRREPVVSLMSAVASTGAAISPAMGSRTSDVFRPLIALSNVRLGRWVPLSGRRPRPFDPHQAWPRRRRPRRPARVPAHRQGLCTSRNLFARAQGDVVRPRAVRQVQGSWLLERASR